MRRQTPTKKSLFPMGKGHLITCLAALLLCVALVQPAAAGVSVYAEGAYNESELVLDIYADIDPAILSFGVRVNYPSGLIVTEATKNDAVWYFGEDSPGYTYMDPENDGSGVVIIGGKLDTDEPSAGVVGNNVLLGTVTFSHTGMTDFSGVSISYGRGDGSSDYKNFVETDGTVLDGTINFNIRIVCKLNGDANRDGVVNIQDLGLVQSNWLLTDGNMLNPRADINKDGVVNIQDLGLVQSNWLTTCP